MATQLSTARKLTLKVRMFLQKYGILLLERTRKRCEGAYQSRKLQVRKVSELLDPCNLVGGQGSRSARQNRPCYIDFGGPEGRKASLYHLW